MSEIWVTWNESLFLWKSINKLSISSKNSAYQHKSTQDSGLKNAFFTVIYSFMSFLFALFSEQIKCALNIILLFDKIDDAPFHLQITNDYFEHSNDIYTLPSKN